jgi:hypothetical protein
MNVALAVLAAASAPAQPIPPTPVAPAAAPVDVQFYATKDLKLSVSVQPEKAKDIDQLRLFASSDGGSLYEIKDRVDPSKQSQFSFKVKDDGEYWVRMQTVFKNGTLDPKDPSRLPPEQKLVVDTTKPVVTVTQAEAVGDEVAVAWTITDKHPVDRSTRVWYKPTGTDDTQWQQVPEGNISKRTARFKPAVGGPLTVQVGTLDLAGNNGFSSKEVAMKGAITPAGGSAPLPPATVAEKEPIAPAAPPPLGPGKPAEPFNPTGPLPVPAPFEPEVVRTPTQPITTPAPTTPPTEALKPIATSTAPPPAAAVAPAATPPADAPTAQFTRSPRFELSYTLDSGASGVARVDLYVSRDDGRSWVRWSQHDGRETPLKVVLDTKFNKEVEGDYGLALVPVSGAGLSDGAPAAGTAPEMKVRVDTTAPIIKVYAPTADPNNKAALVLNWEATDKNFGRDPIAIEYAEAPQGPWKSVTGTDGPTPTRVENSGQYSWQPPVNLATPKVYLRFAAWDLAGNKSEVTTPNPILVDLTKPKARIQGISATVGR